MFDTHFPKTASPTQYSRLLSLLEGFQRTQSIHLETQTQTQPPPPVQIRSRNLLPFFPTTPGNALGLNIRLDTNNGAQRYYTANEEDDSSTTSSIGDSEWPGPELGSGGDNWVQQNSGACLFLRSSDRSRFAVGFCLSFWLAVV